MKNLSLRWRITLVPATFSASLLMTAILTGLYYCGRSSFRSRPFAFQSSIGTEIQSAPHGKLLRHAPLPSGIPTYTVEIMNVCATGCDIAGIHLSCGWFSSARLINPRIFRWLRYDDCLVNAGKPLANGRTISFQYANTFSYPLSVSKVMC